MLVLDAMGDHMVEAYSSMGLAMALYGRSIVSLYLPHLVDDGNLRMGSVLDALDAVWILEKLVCMGCRCCYLCLV